MRNTFPTIAVFLTLSLTGFVHGQNQAYDQIAPKPAPGFSLQPPSPPPPARTNVNGQAREVLLPRLKALVFLGEAQAVAPHGITPGESISFRQIQVPKEVEFRPLMEPYLGRKLTRGDLNELITKIIVFYRDHDRPVVDVIVPPQDVNNGVLQVLILESRVGKVSVVGNRWFPAAEIKQDFRAVPGGPIGASATQADLDFSNQNPFHTSDIVYQAGHDLGTTDQVIQTQDRFPARFYGGYEDSGNPQTGFDRYLVGLNWGDAFALGLNQQLNYQYTTSGDGQGLRAHSGSYVIPLPWHHTLMFFGSQVETQGHSANNLNIHGRSEQISGRYTIPLHPIYAYKHSFSLGWDYKYNLNSLEFGDVPLTHQPIDIDQFVFSYDSSLHDPWGQSSFDENLYFSPGSWGGHNQDADFYGAHTYASSSYVYDNIQLQRLTKLPYEWSLLMRGSLQLSNGNLAPTEQIGFGGYDTIRGYDERELNTDEGYTYTVELRTPTVSLGDAVGIPGFKDQLQFLTFWDYGVGFNYQKLPGERNQTALSSVGFGIRYNINTNLSFRSDYGMQLIRTGLDNDHGFRSDIGMIISY